MQIMGVSIGHRGREAAWNFLGNLTSSQLRRRHVTCEEFIQGSVGPGCFEFSSSVVDSVTTLVVHDSDGSECLVFVDPKTGVEHIADKRVYAAAEAIRPDRFLFEDHNNPGFVFQGSRDDFENLLAEGGNPHVFYGPTSPDESKALVGFGTEHEEWVQIRVLGGE